MPAVSGYGSAIDAYVEITVDGGTTWTDISGATNSIDPDPTKRKFDESYVFGAEDALVGLGKNEAVNIKMGVLYTEGATDPFQLVLDAYINKTTVQFRWTPFGNVSGNKRYTTGDGKVFEFQYPKAKADEAKLIMCELQIRASGITQDEVP